MQERIKKTKKLTTVLIIVVLLILGGVYFIFSLVSSSRGLPSSQGLPFTVSKSGWQAIFLKDGRVYFGQVVETTEREVALRNVYYLQATEPHQGHVVSAQAPFLIKLDDEMRVNREQVLFIEDLQQDSSIVEVIEEYQSQ